MAFDFTKEYKRYYLPSPRPEIIEIPPMTFLALEGQGDPNEPGGAYAAAVGLLYGLAYTIKMSYKGPYRMEGFFEYKVPPLEGLWWQQGVRGVDYADKAAFQWISMLRVPDFVTRADFDWAVGEAIKKKKQDFSKVTLFTYDEGLCVQCLHLGPYDDEPATVRAMEEYARAEGFAVDITDSRRHHEIYLTDPRKGEPSKQKTVVRHPVKPL